MKGFKDGQNTLIEKKNITTLLIPLLQQFASTAFKLEMLGSETRHINILAPWHLIRTSFLSGVHA